MQTWRTVTITPVLQYGKYLTVENHVVALPDGRTIDDWPWLVTPDFVNVVATTPDGDFLCFRQVKYGLEGESLAVVGGFIEPGEDPLAAARRELLEETGYAGGEWFSLGSFRVDPNRGAGMGYFYLAQGVELIAETTADDLEEQHLHKLGREEIEKALLTGLFKALAWSACLSLALLRLKR